MEEKGDNVRQRIREIERNQQNIRKNSNVSVTKSEKKSEKTTETTPPKSELKTSQKTEKRIIVKPQQKLEQKPGTKKKEIEGNRKLSTRSPLPVSPPLSASRQSQLDLKETERKEMREKQRLDFESFKKNKRAEKKTELPREVSES